MAGIEDSTSVFVDIHQSDTATEYWRKKHPNSHGTLLVSQKGERLCIFPKKGIDVGDYQAYKFLQEIRLEQFDQIIVEISELHGEYIKNLPKGLGAIFKYGLTFPKRYRPIAELLDEIGCTTLQLTHSGPTQYSQSVLSCSYDRFQQLVAEIDLLHERSSTIRSRIKRAIVASFTNEAQGSLPVDPTRGRNPAIQSITDAFSGKMTLNTDEEGELLDLLSANRSTLSRQPSKKIGKLRSDLDLVALETLIDNFQNSLKDKHLSKQESHWENFLKDNPFALQQLFGAPVIRIENQLQVLSPRSDGKGSRKTDFILANSLLNEALIVEIKTPQTPLLYTSSPYRGIGSSAVYRPSSELSGAVVQLQSQKESLRVKLGEKLPEDDPLYSLKHASPRGALIAGTVEGLDGAELNSYRWYRDGLHDVTILGFDEVLGRLRELLELIQHNA